MNELEKLLAKKAVESEGDRLLLFEKRWKTYEGAVDDALKVEAGKANDNVKLNDARIIVDKGVSFLFGKDVSFDLVEGKKTPEEEYLDEVWFENSKVTTLQKLALNGAVYGTAFLKIKRVPGGLPRLIVIDPTTISVKLAEDDIDYVESYTIRYPSIDPNTNRPVTIRQEFERNGSGWVITDKRGYMDSANLEVVNREVWNYDFSPIVHCQNIVNPNVFWGRSDLEDDVIGAIMAKNFVISNMMKILRYHGHPKTWTKGVNSADELKANTDEVIMLQSPNAEIGLLEMQNDLGLSLQVYKNLSDHIHELARVPEVSTGKVESVGQLSGIALEILYQPLLELTESKRNTYGELITETNRRLLAINGMGDRHITKLNWQSLLPKDVQVQANAALTKKQLGVSTDTLLQQLGYDPDLERDKRERESESLGSALLRKFDSGETNDID